MNCASGTKFNDIFKPPTPHVLDSPIGDLEFSNPELNWIQNEFPLKFRLVASEPLTFEIVDRFCNSLFGIIFEATDRCPSASSPDAIFP